MGEEEDGGGLWVVVAERKREMKPIPVPPGEEVAPKLVRLLYFVGAGVVCTAAINKWKEFEKKSMIQKEQQPNGSPLENPSAAVHKAVE